MLESALNLNTICLVCSMHYKLSCVNIKDNREQNADAASAMTYRVFLGTKPMKKTNDI